MKLLFLAGAGGGGRPARPLNPLPLSRRSPASSGSSQVENLFHSSPPLLSVPLPQLNSPIFKSKVAHFNARTLAALPSPSRAAAQVCRLLCALFAAAVLGRSRARPLFSAVVSARPIAAPSPPPPPVGRGTPSRVSHAAPRPPPTSCPLARSLSAGVRHRPRRRQQQQRQRRGGEKSRFKGQKAPKGVIARPRGRRARSSTPGSSRGRRGTGRRRCSGPRSPPSGVVVRPSPLCVSFQHKTSFNVLLRALVSLSLSRRGPPA